MKILLTGFMGSGKTHSGTALSQILKLPFFDFDDMIARQAGISIKEIFSRYGENWFRELEQRELKKTASAGVFASGGGIVELSQNRAIIKADFDLTIWLDPVWQIIWQRLKTSKRPLLIGKTENQMIELYKKRVPAYLECASLVYSGNDPQELADMIIKKPG
jgi:shikimate kinase